MFRKQTKAVMGVLVATSVTVAACGSEGGGSSTAPSTTGAPSSTTAADGWDDVVGDATGEGKVVWYTVYIESQATAVEKAFEAKYPGIDVQVVRGLPADLQPRVEQEQQTGASGADLVSTTDEGWVRAGHGKGWWAALPAPVAANREFAARRWAPQGTWAFTSFNLVGIGWSTKVSPAPKSYADLLHPRFGDGKLGIPDISVAPSFVDFWKFFEQQAGDKALERLAALDPVFLSGGSQLRQALIGGEVDAIALAGTVLSAEAAKGAPVAFALPTPVWAGAFQSGALAKAKQPNAARVLMAYLLSPEGQQILAKDNAGVLPNIPGVGAEPDTVHVPDVASLTPEAVAAYTKRFNDIMGR